MTNEVALEMARSFLASVEMDTDALERERADVLQAVDAALTSPPAPSGWQQRIAAMEPWIDARWDTRVCRFCEVERYRMDPDAARLVEQAHEPDCLWQNAKDALPPAPDASPASTSDERAKGHERY